MLVVLVGFMLVFSGLLWVSFDLCFVLAWCGFHPVFGVLFGVVVSLFVVLGMSAFFSGVRAVLGCLIVVSDAM